MSQTTKGWDAPESSASKRDPSDSHLQKQLAEFLPKSSSRGESKSDIDTNIWFNPQLLQQDATENLDSQDPATLYYLGRVVDLEGVVKVFVEKRRDGCRKHWAVLNSRDYDTMDCIYDIEQDTLERFPVADLNFRVTIDTESGPSISNNAVKIYDTQ
jgi:hypothetical protein